VAARDAPQKHAIVFELQQVIVAVQAAERLPQPIYRAPAKPHRIYLVCKPSHRRI
jgi:hypothetical protein